MMGMFWWGFTSAESCPSGGRSQFTTNTAPQQRDNNGCAGRAEGVSLSRKRRKEKCYVMRPVPRKVCLDDPRRAKLPSRQVVARWTEGGLLFVVGVFFCCEANGRRNDSLCGHKPT